MKLNRPLLSALLTMAVAGCASNYHGSEYDGPHDRLPPALWDNMPPPDNAPPAFWDNALNGRETNAPVFFGGADVMRRRET